MLFYHNLVCRIAGLRLLIERLGLLAHPLRIFLAQLDLHRADVFTHLIGRRRAAQNRDEIALCQNPGEGERRYAAVVLLAQRLPGVGT